jgi:hypothetical protein
MLMRIIKVPIPRCCGTIVPNIWFVKRRETPLLSRDECIMFICLISCVQYRNTIENLTYLGNYESGT